MYNNNNNVNNNNRQLNPGQYKNFKSGQFQNPSKPYENRFLKNNNTQQNSNYTEIVCNYCKKPGHLVRDCKIRPNNRVLSRLYYFENGNENENITKNITGR